MAEAIYRAYDKSKKSFVYDKDSWLPKDLKKLGFNEHPVSISQEGIHYTLDCLSTHYEKDWEEDVIAILDIETMQCSDLWDHGSPSKKIFSNDIVSFDLKRPRTGQENEKAVGRVQFSAQSRDWLIVDKNERMLVELHRAEVPVVIGNWFDNPELLG